MLIKHHSVKKYWGSLGTAPHTRIRSLDTRINLRSASDDGLFTTLRKLHPTTPKPAGVLLSTSLCGTTSRSGRSNRSLGCNTD